MIKPSNRRKRRNEYLLDVKVRTEGQLRQRGRWLAVIAAVVAVAGLTGFGVYRFAKFAAARMVYENPRFTITQIIVESSGALTPQQIMAFAGVAVGQNLLSIDLAQVQRNLEQLPLVRNVVVRRMMPVKLYIHVDERLAVARLQGVGRETTGSPLFIDRAGMVMSVIRLKDGTVLQPQAPGPLPVLTGTSLTEVSPGRQVQSEQIYRALELLDRLQQAAAGSMLEIESIDISKSRQLTLTTRQHTVVKFDVAEFPQQMLRLSAIMTWAAQRQKIVQAVDLTVSRGVPVTFVN